MTRETALLLLFATIGSAILLDGEFIGGLIFAELGGGYLVASSLMRVVSFAVERTILVRVVATPCQD
jgi:hypothetical protein